MTIDKKPPTKRQKTFYGNVSPETIDEILRESPKHAQRLWIGITGNAKEPNFQYETQGKFIRRSLKHLDKLDIGTFDPRNLVEIDPKTGALLPLQDRAKAPIATPSIARTTG